MADVIGEGLIWPVNGALEPIATCLAGGGCDRLLYENDLLIFIIMTIMIAGGCAFMSGRSLALSWKPLGLLICYMAIFGVAVRFLQWGLFRGTLMSPYYYLADTVVLAAIASLAWQLTRTSQMVTKYHWLYRRTSPLSWAKR